MTDPNPDEAVIVAEAMLAARWGNGDAAVTDLDLRRAREFIAMADALIAYRGRTIEAELRSNCGESLSPHEWAAGLLRVVGRRLGAGASEPAINHTPCPHGKSYPHVCGICLHSTTEQKTADRRAASEPALDRGNEDGA